MSRVVTAVGGVSILLLWFIVAMSIEFPPLDAAQGWSAVPTGFLIGFMLIPKILGQLLIIGVSAFL
ncbi:MAG TPA: hypothetical protein PLQ56_16370 [Aggregatilineales bacterium]|nr:hypothetical protein [Aggregatilineales bacterium]